MSQAERAALLPTVDNAAKLYGISPALLDAVLSQESGGYNPAVISGAQRSSAGAVGVAQFEPATAEALGVNPTDPTSAIYGAALYLRQQLDTFGGDTAKALAAYNAGGGAVAKAVTSSPSDWIPQLPQETQTYLTAINNGLGNTPANGPADLWSKLKDAAWILTHGTPPGSAPGTVPFGVPPPAQNAATPVENAARGAASAAGNVVTAVPDFLSWIRDHLGDPHWWARGAFTVVGGGMIVAGVVLYFRPTREAVTTAGKAAVL